LPGLKPIVVLLVTRSSLDITIGAGVAWKKGFKDGEGGLGKEKRKKEAVSECSARLRSAGETGREVIS